MANEATAELYTRQSGLNKAKLKTDYEQYLADLATKYGISQDQLNSNLESRGILRSGEAGTAQARLGGANEAAITSAKTTYDYNTATEDVDLMTKLAALQAGSAGSGGSTGGSTGGTGGTGGGTGGDGNIIPAPASRPVRQPGSPGNPNAVRPGTPAPVVKPVYNGGTTQGQLPQAPLPTATPRPVATPAPVVKPVYNGGTTQGQLPQAPLPTKTPDLSGVDWAALGRLMEANKPKPATTVAKPATVTIKPIAAKLR